MSSFTEPLIVSAVPNVKTGWRSYLPPGFHTPKWRVEKAFHYYVGEIHPDSEIVEVPLGFEFDGASVPLIFRTLVPIAHPDYIQAAALHDCMLENAKYSRSYCDCVFYEALTVLGMNRFWSRILFLAVYSKGLYLKLNQSGDLRIF